MNDVEAFRPPLDRAAVAEVTPYWRVEVVDATASTNHDVTKRAHAGEEAGFVLVAEHQTAGRGRLDRTWETPAHAGLTFSVLVRPNLEPGQWPWLPLLAGLATARGIRRSTELQGVGLKWPNDVLINGQKVAGILLERIETPAGAAAVIGIGINVTTTPDELPVPTATSLAMAGATLGREALLIAVLEELGTCVGRWAMEPDWLRTAYATECETVGELVQVTQPTGETISGRASGIDAEGRLEVETDHGRVAVGAGDVVHVR